MEGRLVTPESVDASRSLHHTVDERSQAAEDPVRAADRDTHGKHAGNVPFSTPGYVSVGSAAAGLLASIFLVGFYFVVMTVAEGSAAAIGLLGEDWYLVVPLVVGFGVQVALFWRARQVSMGVGNRSAGAVTGTSGGLSGLSMLACCAHHLADLLPILGLAGLAAFLAEYRETLFGLGIASNLLGIALMLRILMRWRQMV